jgi:methionine-R-sulfoxide reductase
MKQHSIFIIVVAMCVAACSSHSQQTMQPKKENKMEEKDAQAMTENDWRKLLSAEQFYVLREKGTERPGTGKFYKHAEKGIYVCGGCGNELFTDEMKFDSHCGWPSFDKEIAGGKIKTNLDTTHGMVRTEIVCAKCGGHLGHLFDDGPTSTGMRYCVNSLSLDFKKK